MRTTSLFPLFSILLLSSIATVLAQDYNYATTSTSTISAASATASSTYNVFSAIASAMPTNAATAAAGDPESIAAGDAAGASGSDNESLNLSTGAIIAIAVAGGAAIIIGISTALLFYTAHKRQWTVRETMRRSARKVASAVTPRRDTFAKFDLPFQHDAPSTSSRPKSKKPRGMVRIDPPPPSALLPRSGNPRRVSVQRDSRRDSRRTGRAGSQESILEKGFGTKTTIEAVRAGGDSPPLSRFDMDSPVEERKGFSRIFGRR